MKRYLTCLLVLACCLLAWPFYDAKAGEIQRKLLGESVIEQILQRGTLRVDMDVFVPWAMKDNTIIPARGSWQTGR